MQDPRHDRYMRQMPGSSLASDDEVRRLHDHVSRQTDEQLRGIREVLDSDEPGWFATAHADPQAHAPDIDLRLGIALANAEVAKAMADAGFAPDGSVEAKLKLLDAYRRAVVDANVLPERIERKAREEQYVIDKINLKRARTASDLEVLEATSAQIISHAQIEAEQRRLIAASDQIRAGMEAEAAALEAVVARVKAEGQYKDALIKEERNEVERGEYTGLTDILKSTQRTKLTAEEIRQRRAARRDLARAKAPDVVIPAVILILLLLAAAGVTVAVQLI